MGTGSSAHLVERTGALGVSGILSEEPRGRPRFHFSRSRRLGERAGRTLSADSHESFTVPLPTPPATGAVCGDRDKLSASSGHRAWPSCPSPPGPGGMPWEGAVHGDRSV